MEIITPSNYENTPRKPRRSARPCDACRKRKTRCLLKGGSGGRCVHCDLRGSICTFRQGPPQRLPASLRTEDQPAGDMVSGQEEEEETRSEIIHAEPESNRSRLLSRGSSISDDIGDPKGSRTSGVRRLSHVSGLQGPRTDGTSPRESHPNSDTPSLPPTLGLAQHRFTELYGLGSDMEPILMRYRPYDPRTQEYVLETHAIRRVMQHDYGQQYPLTFHMVSDHKAIGQDLASAEADAIEKLVAPNGPLLVDLFWRNIQPSYPILDKENFMNTYRHSHCAISSALLGAVYLSALRWWSYDPELSIRTPPDSSTLRKMVLGAIQNSYHRPKVPSIQAILLLLQCQPEDPLNPDHTFDWGLTCQALAIAQCIGLHLDCSDWSIPRAERNVRRRLSWALFMQDRWTALAYGRPVHIHAEDWAVSDLTDMDFADCEIQSQEEDRKTMTATGKQQFIHMVRLSQILSDILSTFYTTRSSREQDTVLLYQRAKPLLDALDLWSQGIPTSLGMHIIYQRRLSFHGYLHFSLFGVEMALVRRLIRSSALGPPCLDHNVLGLIRQRALQLTQRAINYVAALRPDHLEAFWYFTTPYLFSLLGSFITLLLVTSLSSQERSFWQETLNSYLWTLRTMSKSSEPMQYAANRLEGAILRGLEHALAVNLVEPQDDTVSPPVANGGNEVLEFMDFGDWDLLAADGGSFDWLTLAAGDQPAFMPPGPQI